MREWHLTANDPMAPRIAADARSGRTVYADDQTWQLRLGGPDEPALTLETRYGGRVGLARLVPIWHIGRREVYETQGYHNPPALIAFAPDTLRLRAGLTLNLDVTYEFWTMESQAVGGRCVVANTSDQPQTLRFELSVQAMREDKALQMLYLTLEDGRVALQLGRLTHLQPVLLLEGADQAGGTQARLGRALTIPPGAQGTARWVLGSLGQRDASLALAHKWLAQPSWDAYFQEIDARADAMPQIETGDADLDAALAWSQQLVLRSFLGATGSLPHPSFVMSRKTNQGYAVSGTHSGGFAYPWGGQTVPDALAIIGTVALAAPDLAKGIARNFLAVQRDDGWIDARPGLDGQRVNVLAPPLLATLVNAIYHYTRDRDFLAECLDGLLAFFRRWFKADVDQDRDGVPEWSHPGQGAFGEGPVLMQGQRWAQGVDITTLEAPDLTAYLVREARALLRMAEILERDDVARELEPRVAALTSALMAMWDDGAGVFRYRDRDSHACPTGDLIFEGKGDQALNERTALPQPGRLILRVIGGMSHKPTLDCTLEGIDAAGRPTNETIPANAFNWYRGMGSATTTRVWRELAYLKFGGLSRVFKIEARAADLSRHDQSLLAPLWSGALADDQVRRMVAMLTDPAHYWRAYGVSGCPASDPAYDPAHQNGCGGMWPAWNARLAWALIELGYSREAADLFRRVSAAQARSLKTERVFRALYNPDTGDGLGDADTVDGVVSLDWFARLFGAHVLEPGLVAITGPFAWDGEPVRWTQHGVTVERSDQATRIAFPTAYAVDLPPDAEPQIVHDPNAKKRKAPPPVPAPPPEAGIERPDEGLLPDEE
jgi:hypothetical protein